MVKTLKHPWFWLTSNIMMPTDQGEPVLLDLPDLSSAFDTVEHIVLFPRLKEMFGLPGK